MSMVLLSSGDTDRAITMIAAALYHGVPPVLLRLTVHKPRVCHLFPLLRQVLDHSDGEEVSQ